MATKRSDTDLDSFTSFKARSQGQSIESLVCVESFRRKQSNSVESPSYAQVSLCEPLALPYQQCTCIGVSMRARKHSPSLPWSALLRSVPNTRCGLGTFRPHGDLQSCFAVSPLLEVLHQPGVVSLSALNGARLTETCGDMPPGWGSSHCFETWRKPSRPATATRYESQRTAADSLLWGPVIEQGIVRSTKPTASCRSPAICARRAMQNALANSKCIARWTVNTFVWGPVRFLLVVVIWRFQPSDHGSKVSNSTVRPSMLPVCHSTWCVTVCRRICSLS